MDMSKIKTNIKRFFSNPNTITFILVIGLIVIIYLVYSYMINRAIAPVNVPYCTNEIKTRTEITSENMGTVQISGNFVTASGSNLLQNNRSIRNKYAAPGYFIPKNSFFYSEAVADSTVIEETLLTNAPNDITAFTLDTDFHSTYGCSIMPGNYIDLYAEFRNPDDDNKIVFMPFITGIQVAKVYNSKGLDVFTEAGEAQMNPSKLVFLVTEDANRLLMSAKHINAKFQFKIIPVPRNAGYSENPPETTIDPLLEALINDNTVNI